MIDFKKEINLFISKMHNILKEYPITIFIIFIASIMTSIGLDSIFDSDILTTFLLFFLLFATGTFFSEIHFKNKKKILSIVLFLIISIVLTIFIKRGIIKNYTGRISIVYFLVVNLLSLHRLYIKSKKSFGEYLLCSFTNVLKTSIVYYVLSMGLLLINGIFLELIMEDDTILIFVRIEILLMGLFYIPNIIEDITNTDTPKYNFIKVITHYLLNSIIIVSYFIVYLYVLKIIITWNMPQNEVFRILAILFIISLPIWLLNEYFKDDIISKINEKIPFFLIPLIILQVYTLGVRIFYNGITNLRYIGIILIIFEISYVILYFVNKKRMDYLYYISICLVIITFIFPYINMVSVSNLSQVRMIEKYLPVNDLKVIDSYIYLKNNMEGDWYIEKYLSNKVNYLEEISNSDYKPKNLYLSAYINSEIDISEYRIMRSIENNYYVDNEKVYIKYHNEEIDISNLINSYLQSNIDIQEYFENNHEIIIGNLKVLLTSISISYNNNRIDFCTLNGYILEK